MIAKRIQGANAYPGAPEGWDQSKDGNCHHLAVRATVDNGGRILTCESAWEPTPKELELLNKGGHVILCMRGKQAPVSLSVAPFVEKVQA